MLDNLMDSIGGDVIKNLTEKTGISTEQAKDVLPVAKDTLQSGLMEQVTSGNVGGILNMFNSQGDGLTGNPIFKSIQHKFLGNLMSKVGLPEGLAGMVSGAGLSSIIGGLAGKMGGGESGGEVTQDSMMSSLGLGGGGGIEDMAKGMLKDKLGDKLGGIGKLFG
jgi:hypothetical protein